MLNSIGRENEYYQSKPIIKAALKVKVRDKSMLSVNRLLLRLLQNNTITL